ncbi:hypothetical protein GVX86_10700, partial [[Haemophilus] felis]|nr:hypothetical protein [[Haemophilus] felis]
KLVAGIASGLTATGNSAENIATISQGMKIAENAVENNLLSQAKSEKLIKYMDLLDEKGKLTFNQLDESKKLLDEHNYIDLLIKQHQKNPDLLNENQKSYLREKLSEIALDLVKQNNHRLSFNEALNELYNWDFTQPQIGADYSKLTSEIKRNTIVTDNLDQKLGKSTLEAGLLIGSSPSTLLKGVSFIENTAVNLSGKALGIAPKLEGALANMANDLRYISSEGIYY